MLNLFLFYFLRLYLCKNIKFDFYNNLKEILILVFLVGSMNGGENFWWWKNYFMCYCRFICYEYIIIRWDFVYLEKNDFLVVGDYKFFIKMFEYIDKRVIFFIKKIVLKINEVFIVRYKIGFVYNFKF